MDEIVGGVGAVAASLSSLPPEEKVSEKTTATMPPTTTQRISLPWDFTATELCRSCGKPQTELYELFEHVNSGVGVISAESHSNNASNAPSMRDPTTATHSGSADAPAMETPSHQHSKMDNILQEMQIWQLGVKLDDGLPQRICSKCTAQFAMIGKFRRKCLKVQTRLQALCEERRLEEQQQQLQQLGDKENLDMPPVLEISNDLINDNYGQPLSEVELFESNWTAAETHNESMSQDLLDPNKSGTTTKATANELNDVSRSAEGCPDFVLPSNTGLVNSMDLAIKPNIGDESLIDTQAIFKTDVTEEMTEAADTSAVDGNCTEKESKLQSDEKEEITLEPESGNKTNSDQEVDSFIEDLPSSKDQGSLIVTESLDDHLTESSAEKMCIDLLTSSKSEQAAASECREMSPIALNAPNETNIQNPYKQNNDEPKDCNSAEAMEAMEICTEAGEGESQQLQRTDLQETKMQTTPTEVKTIDSKGSIEMKARKEAALSSTTEPENLTDNNDYDGSKSKEQTLSPSSSRDSKEETTRFVSKAALKEYSSPPSSCYDNASRINERENMTDESIADDPSSAVQRAASPTSTTPPTIECQPGNVAVIFKTPSTNPYETVTTSHSHSEKRRRKDKSSAKPKSLMKQHHKKATAGKSNKITDAIVTRECSVRVCRLTNSQLSGFVVPNLTGATITSTTSTIPSVCDNKESINQTSTGEDMNVGDYRDSAQNIKQPRNDDEHDNESAAVSKKPRLISKKGEDEGLLQSAKRSGSQWKTKAEMKANASLLGLRKATLRAQWKAADAEHDNDTLPTKQPEDEAAKVTSPHISTEQNRKHVITDHATEELVDEQAWQEQPAKTTREDECENVASAGSPQKVGHTKASKHQTAAGHQAERNSKRLKHLRKQTKVLRENLRKLRHRNNAAAQERKSEQRRRGDEPLATNVNVLLNAQYKPMASEFAGGLQTANDSRDVDMNREIEAREALSNDPIAKVSTAKSNEALNNESTQVNAAIGSTAIAVLDAINTNEPSLSAAVANENVDLQVTSNSPAQFKVPPLVEVENIPGKHKSTTNDNQVKPVDNPAKLPKLIVRVPLAVLSEEFQRLHFPNKRQIPDLSLVDTISPKSVGPIDFPKSDSENKNSNNSKSADSRLQNRDDSENDALGVLPTQTNFCGGAAAEPSSESAGAHSPDCNVAAEVVGDNKAAGSHNESDQSEFYGFSNESDAASYGTQDDADASLLEKCSTSISSQITDYINEFQTHCLDIDDRSEPPFTNDVDPQNQNMLQLPTPRDSAHLSSNVMDSFVDNTLNGLLNDIQEQSIFSPSSTPIVTMESEDFHNHSSYSPLSEASSDPTHSVHNDFMHKPNMCDLSDPGMMVNPNHTIDPVNTRIRMPCNSSKNMYSNAQQQQPYSEYAECFTEDSTQSELIGFQNDIPCFENIELNSSTPHRNTTTPAPSAIVETQRQLPSSRATNNALQGPVVPPAKNLEYPLKPSEAGNVQYLGLGNQTDLCKSLSTDSMGLVCTTGTGVQMHTPTMSSSIEPAQKIAMETDTSSSLGDDSREYAVDSATLHLTQIFADIPLHQVQDAVPSTSQNCMRASTMPAEKAAPFNVAIGKNSVLSKFAVGNPAKQLVYTNQRVAVECTANLKDSPQYYRLQPNVLDNGHRNAQLFTSTNTLPRQISTGVGQGALNMNSTKYTLYTEVLPQNLQWQAAPSLSNQQQRTTTYFISTGNMNQSNLITTTTLAVSPIINAGTPTIVRNTPVCATNMSGLNMIAPTTQLVRQSSLAAGGLNVQRGRELDKPPVDANENYIEGMSNQPVMIVFPQDYIKEVPAAVPTLYNNTTTNQVTITPIQANLNTVKIPPPMNPNTITIIPTTAAAAPTSVPVSLPVSVPISSCSAKVLRQPPIASPVPQPHRTQQQAQQTLQLQKPHQPQKLQPPQQLQQPQQPQLSQQPTQTQQLQQLQKPLQREKPHQPQPQKINLTCRFCHKRPKFTNNLDYSNHIIATHPGENPYNCPHCPLFFTRRTQRQQHIVEAHSANRFHCAQCGQSFSAQRTLDVHLQRSHVPAESPSAQQQRPAAQSQLLDVAPSQQQPQPTEGHLATNYRSNASTTWQARSPDVQQQQQQQVRIDDMQPQVAEGKSNLVDNDQLATDSIKLKKPPHRILGCPDCDDSFDDLPNQEPGAQRFSPHSHHGCASLNMPSPEQTEPDSTSTTTLRQFRKQRSSSKSSSDTPERVLRSSHNCLMCEERFTSETTLRKHQQMVHGNHSAMPFVCSICKRGFRMRTALQRHMETHDSVGRPYECNICLVRFPRPSQLTLHKLTVHFLKKPHVCTACGKQFGTESALKTHEKFHGAHVRTHIPIGMFLEGDSTSVQPDGEHGHENSTHAQLEDTEQIDFMHNANGNEIRNPQNSTT